MDQSKFENHRIYKMPFSRIYPEYITKVERKGRTKEELDEVIHWLTGYTQAELEAHLQNETTIEDFYGQAKLNPDRKFVTGVICGVRVEEITHPLMQALRYLDKLVDELAKGKPMEKILRTE